MGGWFLLTVESAESPVCFGVGDVFVVAGQSNAAGHGNGFIPTRTGLVSACREDGGWRLLDGPEGLPGAMGNGSCWPILGDLLAKANGCPVGFVNVAVGGTNSREWIPGTPLYARLVEAIKEGCRAVLWHQGEADEAMVRGSTSLAETIMRGNSGLTHEWTYGNMAAMIQASRKAVGWYVPWYVARASYSPDSTPEARRQVRYAQRRIVKDGLALPGPDTDLFVPPSMRHDGLHFNEVGLTVHALLWYRVLELPGPRPHEFDPALDGM